MEHRGVEPVSLRYACSGKFAIGGCSPCRSTAFFAHYAYASLSPMANAPLGHRFSSAPIQYECRATIFTVLMPRVQSSIHFTSNYTDYKIFSRIISVTRLYSQLQNMTIPFFAEYKRNSLLPCGMFICYTFCTEKTYERYRCRLISHTSN